MHVGNRHQTDQVWQPFTHPGSHADCRMFLQMFSVYFAAAGSGQEIQCKGGTCWWHLQAEGQNLIRLPEVVFTLYRASTWLFIPSYNAEVSKKGFQEYV